MEAERTFGATEEDELARLRLKSNEVLDESVESARRMRALCHESRQMGTETLAALDGQGGEFGQGRSGTSGLWERTTIRNI